MGRPFRSVLESAVPWRTMKGSGGNEKLVKLANCVAKQIDFQVPFNTNLQTSTTWEAYVFKSCWMFLRKYIYCY